MKKLVLCLAAVIASVNLWSATDPMRIVYGPWIQNVTEDSFTIIWQGAEKSLSWVEVAPDDGTTWYQNEYPRYYETVSGRILAGNFHSVTVTGLKKATTYRYRIVGKPIVDESDPYALIYGAERAAKGTHKVRTLDYAASTCRFSMVNDMHFDDAKYTKLMSGMDKEKTDFIVLNGDIVSFSNSVDTLIKHTFDPIKDLAADFPVFFARGNHESRGSDFHKLNSVFKTNTGEYYYTFRQGPVAFIILDAGEDKPDSDPEYSGQAAFEQYRRQELEWLKKVIHNPEIENAPFKVCIMHIPTFDGPDAWYSQHWIAQNFTPVLNEAGVDLMLSGHHHQYILAKAGEYGNKYPILANSNVERLDFEATTSKIVVKTFDQSGAMLHSLTVSK